MFHGSISLFFWYDCFLSELKVHRAIFFQARTLERGELANLRVAKEI
jgi:hypothetical protein